MDGNKPRRYRPIRQSTKSLPPNQRGATFGNNSPFVDAVYPDKLVFADLAPLPAAPEKPDNLLLATVKNTDITMTLPLFDNVERDDTIELVINGTPQGRDKELSLNEFFAGGIITIKLAQADHAVLPEGRVDINYIVHFRSSGNDSEHGPEGQFFTLDYTAPGYPFLGALKFSDEIIANGVTEAVIVGDDENAYLPASVPGYTDLSPGDTITGIVGGQSETVDAIHVGADEIELRFKKSFIIQLEDGPIKFSYYVTDRAGNASKPAEDVTLKVLLKGTIGDLAAPGVPAYEGDDDPKLIDEADARAATGVTVVIPKNANILAGDQVAVLWGDIVLEASPIADPAGDPLASVGVPYAAIRDAWTTATGGVTDAEQTLEVSYRIIRNGLSAGEPATKTSVKVNLYQAGGVDPDPETPENDNLALPVLKSASADAPEKYNEILPGDFDKAATITIPWFRADDDTLAAFIEGDVLRARYGAIDLDERPIAAEDVAAAKDIDLVLSKENIQATGSSTAIPLQYFIDRKLAIGGPNTSSSLIQPIDVSGPDELPGGGKPLAPCEVPEAVGTFPANPDRLLITLTQAKDGTDFIIPAYIHQDPADSITLTTKAFRSTYVDADHANHVPANGDGARDLEITDIHPTDTTSPTKVHITELQLMQLPAIPSQSTHWHITYVVTGTATPPRPVTSAEQLLDVDSRGSS